MSPSTVGDDSSHGGTVFAMSPDNKPTFLSPRRSATLGLPTGRRKSMELPLQSSGSLTSLGSVPRSPSLQQLATLDKAAVRRGAATVHGPGDYWRIMRQASELAAIGSGHGQFNYLRAAARSKEERQEQRKAARLSLDTSAHGGDRYHELLARLESEGHTRARKVSSGMRTSKSTGELRSSGQSLSSGGNTPGTSIPVAKDKDPRPEKAVGPKAPAPLLVPELSSGVGGTEPMDIDAQMEKGGRGRSAAMLALQAGDGSAPGGAPASETAQKASPVQPAAGASQPSAGSGPRTVKRVTFTGTQDSPASADDKKKTEGSDPAAAPALTSAASGLASGPITSTQELESLMRRLHFKSDKGLGRDALAEGLRHLGYDLAPSEVAVLMNELDLDASETVDASEFVASQIDWGAMQRSNRDLWLECAQRAFSDLDENADGHLSVQQLVTSLRRKLPSAEVDFALEDALVEAGLAQAEDIDFEGFLRMLHVGSVESLDSLDQYDPRLRASHLDTSMHGGPKLKPVLEDADDAQ